MNLPTLVMLNRSEPLLWLPVNNGMSKGGISRISELIIPSNRGGEESARGDDASVAFFGNMVLVTINIMRITQN